MKMIEHEKEALQGYRALWHLSFQKELWFCGELHRLAGARKKEIISHLIVNVR